MKVVTVTGYKPHELGIFKDNHPGIYYIKKALTQKLLDLIENGLEWVIISGQQGIELWTAEILFDLQEFYPQVKLAILTPFLNQEERWNEEKQEYYQMILAQADFVDSITKRPYENPGQFKLKNQFLIDKSDGLLVVYDEDNPGTPQYMLQTAKKKQESTNYEIKIITAFDIQLIVEDEQFSDPNSWS